MSERIVDVAGDPGAVLRQTQLQIGLFVADFRLVEFDGDLAPSDELAQRHADRPGRGEDAERRQRDQSSQTAQ
ncbi:hypothetical protein [Diaminobutyricibacter sp. McL0608]|uniref:hypothetical protein n=1 Tax=Leifsonia sp. McL0608 TaxID=3143537 RepID=UPI0031F30C33